MPLNLSPFCASLENRRMWRFCRSGQFVTPESSRIFLPQRRKGAKRCRISKVFLCAFAPLREKYRLAWSLRNAMTSLGHLGKGKLIMKTVVSFLLGAVMLFGAATFGLQSATANAKDKHDKNYWKHHQHRHHKHHRHYKNHLSY